MDKNKRIIVQQNVILTKKMQPDENLNPKTDLGFSDLDRKNVSKCLENLDCVTTDFESQLDQHLKNFITHVTNPNFRKIHNRTESFNKKTVSHKKMKRKLSFDTSSNYSFSSVDSYSTGMSINSIEESETKGYITRLKCQEMLRKEMIKRSRLRNGKILLKTDEIQNEENYLITKTPLPIDKIKEKMNEEVVKKCNFKKPKLRKILKIEKNCQILNGNIYSEDMEVKNTDKETKIEEENINRSKVSNRNRKINNSQLNIAQNEDLNLNIEVNCNGNDKQENLINPQIKCKEEIEVHENFTDNEDPKILFAKLAQERRQSLRKTQRKESIAMEDTTKGKVMENAENSPKEKYYKTRNGNRENLDTATNSKIITENAKNSTNINYKTENAKNLTKEIINKTKENVENSTNIICKPKENGENLRTETNNKIIKENTTKINFNVVKVKNSTNETNHETKTKSRENFIKETTFETIRKNTENSTKAKHITIQENGEIPSRLNNKLTKDNTINSTNDINYKINKNPENSAKMTNYKTLIEENIMNLIIKETEKNKYRNNHKSDEYIFSDENDETLTNIELFRKQKKYSVNDRLCGNLEIFNGNKEILENHETKESVEEINNLDDNEIRLNSRNTFLPRRLLTRKTSCPYRNLQIMEKRKEKTPKKANDKGEYSNDRIMKNNRGRLEKLESDNINLKSVYNCMENDRYCQVILDRKEIENSITNDNLLKNMDNFLHEESEERQKTEKRPFELNITNNEVATNNLDEIINVSTENNCEYEERQINDKIDIKVEPEELRIKTEELDISDHDPIVDLTLLNKNNIKHETKIEEEEEEERRNEEKRKKINELLKSKIITDKDKLNFDSWKKIVLLDEETVRNFNFEKDCDNFNVFLTYGTFEHLPDFVYNNNDVILKILIDSIQLVEVSLFFERWKSRLL